MNATPTATATRPAVTAESTDTELFLALRAAGDAERERIQELIVLRYQRLVSWLASRYAGRAVDTDELVAVGNVGLALAISRFDAEHGADFPAYAKPTIQGEIRRYFRDKRRWIRLPRQLQETKAVLREATDDLAHKLGRAPTVNELAEKLAVSPDLVLEAMTAEDHFTVASLDSPVGGADDEGGQTIADTVAFSDTRFDLFEDMEALRPLLAALPDRDQRILHLRFFEEKTQSEIGEELGVCQMHVSRLLARTLAKLRTGMLADA
ncbi:SigB/SigF/SigG family RNA polymerase sigma factor [Sporichthya sp.]|uniref:SigB/SigF/SigG family RNA polymerase sigma factor n=1 Tax=Sporichthya sp. TaxID=65475 RepID=UPI001813EC79|nr:SigB/SigF/SigG family RNA polymerase sigma factor [Sporichthya sp.]MBA3744470.1 SigB/SigF/SigG family RNA polymerase sigma factor [Sporichthya sp.]